MIEDSPKSRLTERLRQFREESDKWVTVHKEYLPNQIRIYPSDYKYSRGYAVGHYRHIQQYTETQEVRDEIVETHPIYLDKHPELAVAFQVAMIGLNAIEEEIKKKWKE